MSKKKRKGPDPFWTIVYEHWSYKQRQKLARKSREMEEA